MHSTHSTETAETGETAEPVKAAPQFNMQEWQDDALCANKPPMVFFPSKGQPTTPARRICEQCPVRRECLQWALDNDEKFGIWGGLSRHQRRRLRDIYEFDEAQKASQQIQSPRKRSGRTSDPAIMARNEEIREARQNNVSVETLSKKYNLTANTIYRISSKRQPSLPFDDLGIRPLAQ